MEIKETLKILLALGAIIILTVSVSKLAVAVQENTIRLRQVQSYLEVRDSQCIDFSRF